MDRQTGRIYRSLDDAPEEIHHRMMPMELPPTRGQQKRMKVRRNDPCPCGSGRKFKRCCRLTPAPPQEK